METRQYFRILSSLMSAAILLAGCSGKSNPETGYAEYVEAYTGGLVTGASDIVVELTTAASGISGTNLEINEKVNGLFKFSPSLKGTARMETPQRFVFTPEDGSLKSGKRYRCVFSLGEVLNTEKGKENFEFQFFVAEKEAVIEPGLIVIKRDDPGKASVSGTVRFSVPISTDKPEELLSFYYEGTGDIVTELAPDGYSATFTISNLRRPETYERDRILKINFNPGKTGFKECEPVEVTVPAKGEFREINQKSGGDDGNYVDLAFSEPLDSRQNLNGIISTDSENGAISFRIKDNILRINGEGGKFNTFHVLPGIRSIDGERSNGEYTSYVERQERPYVDIPAGGNIIPDGSNMVLPFKAVNLNAVDISIVKIYPGNVLSFLQDNDLDGSNRLRRAGRLVYKSTIRLDSQGLNVKELHDYSIDLSGIIKKEPDAIYRIALTFNKDYYVYSGNGSSGSSLVRLRDNRIEDEDEAEWDIADPYYYNNNYDWSLYNWRDRNDPATPSYYMDYDYPVRNIMFSELGVIAKYSGARSDGKTSLWTAVSNLNTAEPVSGAEITAYNFQLQKIGAGKSESDGLAEIRCEGRPFAVKVRKGESTTYLKVNDGNEKSLSRFDTGGERLQKGIKSFIYGDRGVWRPGDTLHLAMMLHGPVPDSHPASAVLYSPEGQFYTKKVSTGENGLYVFNIATSPDVPTGIWNAYFKVGGATFHKSVNIETIKPNRLKINANIGSETLRAGTRADISIAANWLTGPAASGLAARAEMTLWQKTDAFKGFGGYSFSDPSSSFKPYTFELFSTRLGQDGTANVAATLPKVPEAPGMLEGDIVYSVEEEGGDESFVTETVRFSPYSAYVGVKLPSDYIETGTDVNIPVAVVDQDGQRKSGHRIEWRIFKLKWSWWWESRNEPLDSYIHSSGAKAVLSGIVTSGNSDIRIPFNVDDSQWGRYLIYVRDLDSGHSSGGIFFADWPAYRGRADRKDPDAPGMLSFSLDRKEYNTGETATVFIPAAENGRALVSLENGSGVIRSEWVKTNASEDTPWTFRVTEDMSPNVYVHITLVQPCGNRTKELPVRLYGVIPAMVLNPDSHLEPVIEIPDRLHPEEPFSVKISEKNRKPMTYTLAIVDEGLLDITSFRTPDPWSTIYRREALGVRTWDMYDNLFLPGGGPMKAMFSIGGDEGTVRGARKENRFNPIVRYLGPFTLKSGSQTHRITLPMYVGSVRVMVVAGNGTAYGKADKTVPVTSPLMIMPTLPRTAGPGEKITLPVNVTVMERSISNVNVSVKCDGALSIEGKASESLSFSGEGDRMVRFSLISGNASGMSKVTVTAEGGGHRMTETINLEVRGTSPHVITTTSALLQPGESKVFTFSPFKESEEDRAWIDACGHPSVDWNAMFKFFNDYQHSCSEQICAAGISILCSLPELSEKNYEQAKQLIPELLTNLYSRQRSDGGFAYWPGSAASDEWVSSMALEFLALARKEGFSTGDEVIKSLLNYQKKCIQNYKTSKSYLLDDLSQAYRLFTTALAGSADEAAMNRLKMSGNLSWQGSMMLASAYSASGKKTVGEEIISSLSAAPEEWSAGTMTYGTPFRDKAIALEALTRTGNISGAVTYAAEVRPEDGIWSMSTQESAFAAKAYRELSGKVSEGYVTVDVTGSKGSSKVKGMTTHKIDTEAGETKVTNTSDGPAYVRLTTIAQVAPGTAVPARSSNINLSVKYIDSEGNTVSPEKLRQGTRFTAVIRVANSSAVSDYSHLALVEIVPSGWEIINDRLTGQAAPFEEHYDRLDIRDDRCLFYFSLPKGTYKEFKVRLRAAYEGEYELPSVSCGDMYDNSAFACTASARCSVTR
ncbi:MAG: alpha-2-macroglobulin family protein [Candidatus Cryptobacteroides sp.]